VGWKAELVGGVGATLFAGLCLWWIVRVLMTIVDLWIKNGGPIHL